MKRIRSLGLAAFASLVLAACGGGGDGDQSPRVRYSSMVSFGDSLSDVGSYKVSTIAAVGGGKYTVNGPDAKNWTELISTQIGLGAPCAAQTGLNSVIPQVPAVAVTNHAGCFGYAQGGARVTNPVGPGNVLAYPADATGALGQLTDPVVNQIARHLATVGDFSGTELLTVMAGGNDVFSNLGIVSATVAAATAQPGATPASIAAAAAAAGEAAVAAMAAAGTQLAGYIASQIVGKGATHVVVVNLPDMSQTPFGYGQSTATQGLIRQMAVAFNTTLQTGLETEAGVLLVDAYAQGQDQAAHPEQYEFTNVTSPACDLSATLLPSSLVCTSSTLIAGDVSHYKYADTVHPTPYGYRLLAQFVARRMSEVGWL